MKYKDYKTYIAVSAMAMALAGCSTDSPEEMSQHLAFGMPEGNAIGWIAESTTRDAGTLPTIPAPETVKPDNIGVWGFNDLTDDTPVFSNRKMIYRYGAEAADNANIIGQWNGLQYNEYPYDSPEKWNPSTATEPSRYKFFGYSPFIATTGLEDDEVVAYKETYSEFESFTWRHLSKYTLTDHLVSKSVLEYTSSQEGGRNSVQVLAMEHLYSRLRFCFILGPRFGDLREIHIKELTLYDLNDDKVTYHATFDPPTASWNEETNGGTQNLTLKFDLDLSEAAYYQQPGHPVLDEHGALILSASNREFYGYLPLGNLYVYPYATLESVQMSVVYDVYDKDGVLLRKDETASNTITLNLVPSGTAGEANRVLRPGYYYDVRIEIEPKFLFVLSDNDVKPDGKITIQ